MPETILFVDDDVSYRQEFCECFEEEYSILLASNGEEALKILKKPNEVDLVLLDVRMPGLNGIEVLKKIKSSSENIKVIIFTGYGTKDIAVQALKGHADDYIDKTSEILKIREVLEKNLDIKRGEHDLLNLSLEGKINRVKRFIDRNCYKKVTLQDASKSVFLSPKYLSRIFKEETGLTFNEYKLNMKTGKAKELLLKSELNIDQIAEKLGYLNTESFIRIFKKLTKCTPKEFRVKKKKKKKKK
jgi:YesN/AraC family two-component response regulator